MNNSAALVWMCLVVIGVLAPLIVAAFCIEVLAPRSREWVRRLRALERGREAQRAETQHDEYAFRRWL